MVMLSSGIDLAVDQAYWQLQCHTPAIKLHQWRIVGMSDGADRDWTDAIPRRPTQAGCINKSPFSIHHGNDVEIRENMIC